MIIAEKVKDLVVVGEDTSKKAKISQDKLAKLQYLLTKGLYKDPITAVIAEWTNNGIDSVVQSGKDPIENPVLVQIQNGSSGQYIFRVEDRGIGLDDKDFENICMNYLESTKEEDNDTIGHFGIGMKSFLSLERSATFTCRKDGVERKYIVYEGAEFVNYDLIYEKPTLEGNGVIAELTINYSERTAFIDKARTKLAYYDTAVLIIDGRPEQNEIFRNEIFQWSTACKVRYMHLCLKDVYYPIDWEALGIPQINIPIALRLSLGDGVTPTPSRESYITNEKTKQVLLKKIQEVADWFITKYNENVGSFKTFLEAYEFVDETSHYVKVEDKSFLINELLDYSKLKPNPVKIEGINLQNPRLYKNERSQLLRGYSIVGYNNYAGTLRTKAKNFGTSIESHVFYDKGKVVIVGDNFRGNVREFLKQKYGTKVLFVKDDAYERPVENDHITSTGQVRLDDDCYKAILGLTLKAKTEWQKYIDEWDLVVSTIVSTFKDETGVAETQEYLDWIEQKKQEQREKNKLLYGREYLGLGKQQGDVTLAYSYERYKRIYFEKKAYPIADLHKNQFLTVLFTDDDDEALIKAIVYSMHGIKEKSTKRVNVKFAHVGKKEIRKIPEHHQFINFQGFMSRGCKPFMRLASAIKFERILRDYNDVEKYYKNPVFKKMMKKFNKDIEKLREYVSKNQEYRMDDTLGNKILDAADQHDLFDKELWGEFTRVRDHLRKFDFISLMQVPQSSNHELTKRYETLVNQLLLFRKKYHDDLEGAKIVFEETKTKDNDVV
jgi:hypothetical protein